MLNERDMSNIFAPSNKQEESSRTQNEPQTDWEDVASGVKPWGGTFWRSFGQEALDTAIGIPMLPYLFGTLSKELATAPGSLASQTALGKSARTMYFYDMMLNPRLFNESPRSDFQVAIQNVDFDAISDKYNPLMKALYEDYAEVYGSGEGFKEALATEPWRVFTDVFAVATIGGSYGSSLLLKTGKLSRTARVLARTAKVLDFVDPGNIPGRAVSAGFRGASRILPPPATLANIKKRYGIDAETDLPADEAAGRFAAGAENAPLSMIYEGDELAARESQLAFSGGIQERMTTTMEAGQDFVDEKLRTLADQAGVPHSHLKDPVAATRDILKGVITAWEQGDLAQRQKISNAIADLRGKSTSPFEARILLEDSLQAEYDRTSQHFSDEYDKNTGLMEAEVGEFGDDVAPDADGTPPAGTPDSQATLNTTRENTQMIRGNWGGKYRGQYGVTDIDNLIFSHDIEGNVNPLYPQHLQKRNREGYASQTQTRTMAQNWDPELALDPSTSMNAGSVITVPAEKVYTPEELTANPELAGKQVVLSGTGRSSAYKEATTSNPEGVAAYQEQLRSRAAEYGLSEDAVQGDNPFLYRELRDDVDYESFSREANEPTGQAMRVSETARADASMLDSDLVRHISAVDATSLRDALKDPANSTFVQGFINRFERDKRSAFYDESGRKLSDSGFARIENALIAYVMDSEFGKSLIETFTDTSESGLMNLERGVRAALPHLAEFKALLDSGDIAADYAIMDELAYAIRKVDALLKETRSRSTDNLKTGEIIDQELRQELMFDDPLDVNARMLYKIVGKGRTNPGAIREFIRRYTEAVSNLGGDRQGDMFGQTKVSKEEVLKQILGEDFGQVPEGARVNVVTDQGTDMSGLLGLGAEAGVDISQMMPSTIGAVEELTNRQGHTRTLLADPEVEVALGIVNDWFSDEMSENLGRAVETSGQGMKVGDFVRLRTNFRKRLDIAVGKGDISKVGAGDLNKIFYDAITEDIDTLLSKVEGEGRVGQDEITYYKDTNRKYSEQMDLQATNVARTLDRLIAREGDVVKFMMDLDPRQLQEVKQLLGEEGFAEQQPAILQRILDDSVDADGNLDINKMQSVFAKMQVPAHELLGGELATTLFDLTAEVERQAELPRLRESTAAKFILKNVERPENLFYELTKERGVFDADAIKDAKEIFGEEKWDQIKTGLMGFLFDQGYLVKTNDKNAPRRSFAKVLGDMTGRDRNRLVNIFGEEEAKELMEIAGFWERHSRLAGWGVGSHTGWNRLANDYVNKRSFRRFATNVAYWIQFQGLSGKMLDVTNITSISLLVMAFGTPVAFREFMKTEAGRAYMKSGGIPIGGTGKAITSEDLTAAADFIDKHRVMLSHAGLRLEQARKEAKKPQRKKTPAYSPLQRFLPQ